MKQIALVWLVIVSVLYAFDETQVNADIAQAQSVEALVSKMQQAPKEFRHRYIEAITEKTSLHNQQKRELLTQEMIDQINAEKGNVHTTGLTGGGNGNGAGGSNGSGSGGGKGNGGRGGGRK